MKSWNGEIPFADAVALLYWLFHGGAAHVLGEEPRAIPGCP
jgi:hypothetical protein